MIEEVAPCRHPGAPPDAVVERVRGVIQSLVHDEAFLASKGLSSAEYSTALPAAIEQLRGSQSASNADRRAFLISFFNEMNARGLITGFETPTYGDDTVYRLAVPDLGSVAVIQKGCPDGAHSSVNWTRPDWAEEAYLWWLCSSTLYEPGVHVWKGVNRLKKRFFSDAPDLLDGVIFHNELCGTPSRPCPKDADAIEISGYLVPPPCIFLLPHRKDDAGDWNWDGDRDARFPAVVHAMFGIDTSVSSLHTGHVGFRRRLTQIQSKVSANFGAGRSTSHRS